MIVHGPTAANVTLLSALLASRGMAGHVLDPILDAPATLHATDHIGQTVVRSTPDSPFADNVRQVARRFMLSCPASHHETT